MDGANPVEASFNVAEAGSYYIAVGDVSNHVRIYEVSCKQVEDEVGGDNGSDVVDPTYTSYSYDLSDTDARIEGAEGEYAGLYIDATNGKFAGNNSGWTQVNCGTIITFQVAEGAIVSVSAYISADNFYIHVEDGWASIEAIANDYLKSITVTIS